MNENYIQEDTKITPKDIEEYMNKLDERFFNADFVDVMSMRKTVPSLPKGECV